MGMGRLGPHLESQLLGASQDLNPALGVLHAAAIRSYYVRVNRIIIIIIFNVYRHENAIRKGPHPLYRTEAELDGSQLSKWHLVI